MFLTQPPISRATWYDELSHLETVERKLLGPGERATMLVQGGPAGVYELRSEADP